MSLYTEKKAKQLIKTNSIEKIDEGMYQVKSSVPNKSYVICDLECECKGFMYRGNCSHVQAVKMMLSDSAEGHADAMR